jgi:hypothetical protein
MGFSEEQEAYNKGLTGGLMSPTDPHYGSYVRGQGARTGGGHDPYWAAPIVGQGVRAYLKALIGAPIGIGLIVGVVALVGGGNFVVDAAAAAALTFLVILLMGLVVVAFRLMPLLIVVALVLYALHRWLGIL